MVSLLELIFGCRHKRFTRPITPIRRTHEDPKTGSYVACLDCGRRFHYDPETMKMGPPIAMMPPTHTPESLQTQY